MGYKERVSAMTPENSLLTEQVSPPYWIFSVPLSRHQESAMIRSHYSCHLGLSCVLLGNCKLTWKHDQGAAKFGDQTILDSSILNRKVTVTQRKVRCQQHELKHLCQDFYVERHRGSNLLHVCDHWWHLYLLHQHYSPIQIFWDARVYCSTDLILTAS